MILESSRWSFGLEIKSNMDSNESGHFLLTPLYLKQYILSHEALNVRSRLFMATLMGKSCWTLVA
jgi:hypothetical protein